MLCLRWRPIALAVLSLVGLAGEASAQIGPGPFVYFPTDNITDARFLGFGCPGTATFEQPVTIGLAVPAGTPSFTISLFDGDTGRPDGAGKAHWDLGTRQISMSLFADPLRNLDTSPASLVGNWKGNDPNPLSGPSWTASAATMPDNDWWGVTIAPSAQAQAPSGNYFYTLVIQLDGACTTGESLESNLKIAASNPMAFLVPRFGIVAALRQINNDGPIVYPGPTFPPPGGNFVGSPTTYDGTFEFSFSLPPGETDLRLYDGDFDHGTNTLIGLPSGTALTPCLETDDLDTPADYSGFPFSTTGLSPEGAKGPGVPADDSNLDAFRRGEPGSPGRVGCVRYEVTDPSGTVYRNDNPSGSFEWEQFRIAGQQAFDPNDSDYVLPTDTLPSGIWKVRLIGLDMSNLNFFAADACSTRTENGQLVALCPTVNPYLVGTTVWLDSNGNGVQDPDEEGIPGASVGLYKPDLTVAVQTATTGEAGSPNWDACQLHNTGNDLFGLYCFGVDRPGTYTVQVAPANFLPGGALYGLVSTTGDEITATLTDDNVLIYNFGYRYDSSLGDRVWNDLDGDGVQDPEEPGIESVVVELLDADGVVVSSRTTDADGVYTFPNLAPGDYTVRVDTSTLPNGMAPTFDRDGVDTPHEAAATIERGKSIDDADFGYRATGSIGNRVWNDADGDGVQDTGEAGFNGVTVRLLDNGGNVLASTVTGGDGAYSFDHLQGGSYTVQVVAATLPAGYAQTYDFDGVGSANQATVELAPGGTREDIDFGYRAAGSIGNRVWNDTDGDGVQDAGETGLNSVIVELRNGGGTVIATTTTSGDGEYSFPNLPAGSYSVRIVSSTLPPGVAPTYDLDGVASAHTAAVTLNAGQNRADVDFGYRGTGALGDRVWYDYDGDGVQDAGEPGLSGVTVELLNGGGTVIATRTTDSNGIYNFTNLAAGSYTVRVVTSTFSVGGLMPTYDLDGTGTPHTAAVTLGTTSRTDVDFGYRSTRSLGDRVWNDADGDGVQDSGEAGINGVTVRLFLGTSEVMSTVTSGNGNYTFTNIPETTYTVRIDTATLPAGMVQTYDLDGLGSPHQATVNLTASRADVDYGYRGTASAGDRIWNDADGDGVQDATETGINGVTVQLLSGSTVIASATTSGNGNYSFGNLTAGTYIVRVVSSSLPAGLTPTFDLDGTGTAHTATFTLAAGAARTDIDFGYRTPPVTCTAGYVKDHFDSASFSNNDGTLSWAGAWIESDVAGAGVGSGNVTVGTPYAGYLFLRDSPDTGTQPSAARQVNLTGFASATLSFSFHVRTAVDPDDAVVVEVSNNGGASYTVLETLDGFSGTYEGTRSYNISAYIASNTRVRFRVSNNYGASDELFKLDWVKIEGTCAPTSQNGSIGNRVWSDTDGDAVQDSGEPGINGVTVQLLNSSGTVIATTTTAGDGNYSFGNLATGSYSVRIVTSTLPANSVRTYDLDGTGTANIAAVVLAAGQNRTDGDFGYKVQTPSCTAGYVKDLFNNASFSNNDGTLSWAGAWIESDTAGAGVSSGNVTVGNPYAGYLFLRDYPDTGTQPSAARQVSLSGFASATLSFSFHVRTAVDPDDAVVVEVSNNGGSSYTVLETLKGFSGTAEATRSYNISAYIAGNTRVRFRVTNGYGASDELFKLDWIKIEGTCAGTN